MWFPLTLVVLIDFLVYRSKVDVDCLSFDETQLLGKPWQLQHSREKQPLWKLFSGVRVHSRMHVREENRMLIVYLWHLALTVAGRTLAVTHSVSG